jgi:hypothetical protein
LYIQQKTIVGFEPRVLVSVEFGGVGSPSLLFSSTPSTTKAYFLVLYPFIIWRQWDVATS